jgi:predicted SAM-dependent methyltransferase
MRHAATLPLRILDRYGAYVERTRLRQRPQRIGLNIGTGGVDLPGWVNIDETKPGDILAHVPPLPIRDASVTDVMMSHVLEHMPKDAGIILLAEVYRVLESGGELTIIVPDTPTIALLYLLGGLSNFQLNDLFLYSYCQESHHQWSYDWPTVEALLLEAGFTSIKRINRFTDPRLMAPAWFQVAGVARKEG